MRIVSSGQMREWEHRAIEGGSSVEELMGQAVSGCLKFIKERFPCFNFVRVLAGKGHNGNDALWLGRCLEREGWRVEYFNTHFSDGREPVESASVREAMARAFCGEAALAPLAKGWGQEPCLVVDGLLGVGAQGAPRGVCADMIRLVNKFRTNRDVVVALDGPSGVDAETGEVHEPALAAGWTLSIGAIKKGFLSPGAGEWVGRLSGVPLDLDEDCFAEVESAPLFVDFKTAAGWVKPLSAHAYKHRRGTVAIWAGSPGMAGAAVLAARAAMRSGTGLVRLFTHPEVVPLVALATPEVMVHPYLPGEKLPDILMESDALLAGPGLGTDEGVLSSLRMLLEDKAGTMVLDADALNSLAANGGLPDHAAARLILTPHAAELSRLCGGIKGGRAELAGRVAEKSPCPIVVAKGPNTLVVSKGLCSWNGSGNPGMATAGSGDVLAGIIAGLVAQGYDPLVAARLGVFWHGASGDLAVSLGGEQTLMAGDLIGSMGKAWLMLSGV